MRYTQRTTSLWTLLLGAALLSGAQLGCGASEEDRRGAVGEPCVVDRDCREALMCTGGVCRSNALEFGRTTQDSDDGDLPQARYTCDDFCDPFINCDFGADACPEACAAESSSWSVESFDAVVACLGQTTCDDLPERLDPCLELVSPSVNPDRDDLDPYRYLLIEDLSVMAADTSPGLDLDAVVILGVDGVERFATGVEDFSVHDRGNSNPNVIEVLGPPDSECASGGYVSLGGMGGYVVLSFASAAAGDDGAIDPGSVVEVYTVGPFLCPNEPERSADPLRVSVSVSTNRSSFVEVGSSADSNVFIVP